MLKRLKDIFINNPKLKMFQFKMPQTPILQAIYNQINGSLLNAYKEPMMKKYLSSLPTKTLLDQSVVMYVGSKTRPKNQTMTKQLLDLAKAKAIKLDKIHTQQQTISKANKNKQPQDSKKARNQQTSQQQNTEQREGNKQLNLVKYYQAYFMKRAALQSGNQANFSLSTQNMIQLVQKNHPLSCFLVANELLKYVQAMQNPQQIEYSLHRCLELYNKSITENHFGGLLHIGEILQKEVLKNVATTDEEIQEFFIFSAAYGNSIAYYKLALLYKKKGNLKLYLKYLKQAAQKGVLQSQHDLAIEYLQGKNVKKDQFKAFSWFFNAAAHNFLQSKFNTAQIFLKGTSCGKILPNKKAALIYFQQINKTGMMDVSSHIKSLLYDEQLQEQLKNQKQEKIQQSDIQEIQQNLKILEQKQEQLKLEEKSQSKSRKTQ